MVACFRKQKVLTECHQHEDSSLRSLGVQYHDEPIFYFQLHIGMCIYILVPQISPVWSQTIEEEAREAT